MLTNLKSLHTVSHSLATRSVIFNIKKEIFSLICAHLQINCSQQHETTSKLKLNVFLRSKP